MVHHIVLLLVGWTVEEGLAIDSPPLLKLLFQLIGNYLLGDHGLSTAVMHRTIVLRLLASFLDIGLVLHIWFIDILLVLFLETVFELAPDSYWNLVNLMLLIRNHHLIVTTLH